jgi:CSLREA domain-containing protein
VREIGANRSSWRASKSAARVIPLAASAALGLVSAFVPLFAPAVLGAGLIIQVTTAADTVADDGLCSLREALVVSNIGGYSGVNSGECQGSTSTDSIRFASSVGVINVASNLPEISAPVFINGLAGRSVRVEIHGPGTAGSTGLNLSAAGAPSIRGLIVDNFDTGIYTEDTDATIAANVIGPNQNYGIRVAGSGSVTIGGANPGTPDVCSGACNRISGNATGIGGTMYGSIEGNLIGLNSQGNGAQANGYGIYLGGAVTIGGATADMRNVISGNTTAGVSGSACSCTIQGNYIGTDVTGTVAVANGQGVHLAGWYCPAFFGCFGYDVGGSNVGEGNLISGNSGAGIYVEDLDVGVTAGISGNVIGVSSAGQALGNGGDGIEVGSNSNGAYIGSGNVIAYNGHDGVEIVGPAEWFSVRGNSVHDNAAKGIELHSGTNASIAAPAIAATGPVHGTSCAACIIDVYSDSSDEGKTYEGAVAADGSGHWTFSGTPVGPNVTATATDADGDTSEFSAPATVSATTTNKPDGRVRKGSGSLVGDNVYNSTGLNQTKSGSTTPGNTIKFGISVQNDATTSDQFKVHATGVSATGYAIKYFHGTADITAAVVAGTYTTPALATGGTFLITAKVKVTSTAATGSRVTRLATITSVADATRQDAVKFIVNRS